MLGLKLNHVSKRGPSWQSGPGFNIKIVFPSTGLSIIKVRQSWDHLIFIMGIHILVKRHIETVHRWPCHAEDMVCMLLTNDIRNWTLNMAYFTEHIYYTFSLQFSVPWHCFDMFYCQSTVLFIAFLFNLLTHWGRDKIDSILQTTFSSAFSWTKMFEFQLRYHWSLFLKVQLTIFQHWFR